LTQSDIALSTKLTRSSLEIRIQKKKNALTNFDTGFVVVVFLFVYSKKGICITNYGKTWEKLMMAKAYYAKVSESNPSCLSTKSKFGLVDWDKLDAEIIFN
ncbi:hypothetical protein C5167_035676, partial [Papaver somniferum]